MKQYLTWEDSLPVNQKNIRNQKFKVQSDVSKSAAKMCTLSVLAKCNSYILG